MEVVEEERVKMKKKPSAKRTLPQTKRQLNRSQKSKKLRKVFNTQQKATSCKRKRVETDHIDNGDEAKSSAMERAENVQRSLPSKIPRFIRDKAKSSAMERAENVQRNLPSEIPSIIKPMLPSHVTGGFWLGLPKKFCDGHLPKFDSTIVLVDKSGTEYMAKYLVRKTGLSGGWRAFSIAHNLLEGDVLVFGLVQPTKFMVHIMRTNGFDEVGGAPLVFLNLEACVKQEHFGADVVNIWRKGEGKCLKKCSIKSPQETTKESPSESTMELGLEASQSENDSDGHAPEIPETNRSQESAVDFKEVKSIKDFSILVNGLAMNSKFSQHLQAKYYDLCCSQKGYIHGHLLYGLNHKLAAGIITETVDIADAIRASNLTTCRENFPIWSKTLKAFQELGMNVGFLRARLDQLMSFGFVENRRRESRLERMSAEEKIRDLERSLLHVKGVKKRLDAEIDSLNSPAKNYEVMYQELAKAPW